ncbi:carbohydrate porin [Mariprofundus sp. EBB-1]|uniref:carbohydrate porin n=1 Tax=Mariprofundus sp. EBB-1 TaxID=2650971 RepID=UPI000EF19C4C|nr:carbohydrate porin [Mariprofundus sp. EBB-1]RLL51181.1 carbohydrate porin [Mariprofundus sp. EBB-1]
MKSYIKRVSLFALCGLYLGATPATAEDISPAVMAELSYVAEAVRNNGGGGLRKGMRYEAAGTLTTTVDTEKLGWWPGGTAYVEFIVNHGSDPSAALVGDFQTLSNIADGNRTRLQQLWFEQSMMDGVLSLLLGTHDLNSEFDVTEYGGLFTNSSFGIGPDISGNVATSLWPEAGLAARIALQVGEHVSLHVAGYDGDPATRGLKASEGYLYIAEAAYVDENAAYKVGAWRHSKAPRQGGGLGLSGAYLVVDQPLWQWDERALGAFLQLGYAQRGAENIKNYVGAGLHVSGFIPGRGDDEAGVAMARADFSKAYLLANRGFKKNETVFEITYRAQLTDWLAIQPAFQYIISPSGDPALKNAKVALIRVEAGL